MAEGRGAGSRPRRVAVIHDWLTGMRGGEQVLEEILSVVPEAEIFTLFHFPGSVSRKIESHAIHTSLLQHIATRASDYRRLLPLFPHAVRQWDLGAYDAVISSSHCVAKGVDARGRPHVSYCHTPMRYIWDRFDDYFPRSKPLQRLAMKSFAPWLRRWDVRTAGGVSRFVANSEFVRGRIQRYYGREADVVHPFVDEAFLAAPLSPSREPYHMIVSALVPYKKIGLAIDAAEAGGKRLLIAGGGPLLESLRARRSPNVELMGHVSREAIIERLAQAQSLILPGIEDFGITPLEAMALGTPVVALREGGVLDTVVEGRTGVFFEGAMVESLQGALAQVESATWDRQAIRGHASGFSRAGFHDRFRKILEQTLDSR
jgi:glycosyltransferase involved in cell wall biosynthesis